MKVSVGSTRFTRAHKDAVMRVLDSGRVSPGPVCAEFEDKFARYHGAKYGLFVNSGTDALRLALLAMKEYYGWKDGSYVIVPASTFVATANVVLQAKLKPFPIDVSMYDSNLNPDAVEHMMTCNGKGKALPNLVAMMPVHLFGKICDMDRLGELAKRENIKIIEDSCESMGVAPLYGDIACYSGYVCHLINTGVGGLAITSNARLHDLMRSLANHGRDFSHIPGYRVGKMENRFKFDRIGYSARATEMQAALGLVELKNLAKNIRRRKVIVSQLLEGLKDFRDLVLPFELDATRNAFMMFPIFLRENSKVKKWTLCKFLEKHGVETRDWLSLDQPCYQGHFDTSNLMVSKLFKERGFYIGCHNHLTDEDVQYVIRVFKKFFKQI